MLDGDVHVTFPGHLSRIGQGHFYIVPSQRWIAFKNLVFDGAGRLVVHDQGDPDASPLDARLAVADIRINGDTFPPILHFQLLLSLLRSTKFAIIPHGSAVREGLGRQRAHRRFNPHDSRLSPSSFPHFILHPSSIARLVHTATEAKINLAGKNRGSDVIDVAAVFGIGVDE